MPKISIYIPCYKVQNAISEVLKSFSADVVQKIDELVVVENFSPDKTLAVLKEFQQSANPLAAKTVIIANHQNYGLGGSQKIGYQYFLDRGIEYFMIIHGDNQTDSNRIVQRLLKTLEQNPQVDIVICSRFTKGADTSGYNQARLIGNLFFNWLTFALTGLKMTDAGTGIMLIRTDVLKRYPFMDLTNSFQFNPQLNIFYYGDKNLKIIEVPLEWKDSNEESNIKALNYCWTLLKILLRYRWNKTVLRKSGWQLFYNESQRIKPAFSILKPANVEPKGVTVD